MSPGTVTDPVRLLKAAAPVFEPVLEASQAGRDDADPIGAPGQGSLRAAAAPVSWSALDERVVGFLRSGYLVTFAAGIVTFRRPGQRYNVTPL